MKFMSFFFSTIKYIFFQDSTTGENKKVICGRCERECDACATQLPFFQKLALFLRFGMSAQKASSQASGARGAKRVREETEEVQRLDETPRQGCRRTAPRPQCPGGAAGWRAGHGKSAKGQSLPLFVLLAHMQCSKRTTPGAAHT